MSTELSAQLPEPEPLTCPQCRQAIIYYDERGSEYFVCPHCRTYFRQTNEQPPQVLGTYEDAPAASPVLPLGKLGTLEGSRWRVLGVMLRYEHHAEQYRWREYQLHCPDTGKYAQLAEFDGHWVLVRPAQEMGGLKGQFAVSSFQLYHRYLPRVAWALGEFGEDVAGNKDLQVSEYIRPPHLLVLEQQGKAKQWYVGQYLEPWQVAEGFGVPASALPPRTGIGAAQPDPLKSTWPALLALSLLALGILLLIQLSALALRPSRELLTQSFWTAPDSAAAPGTSRPLVSNSFLLVEQAALELDIRADLDNQWLELPISLVEEASGRSYELTRTVERYSGVEDGESWTEGNLSTSAVLSAVPPGLYHLNFYPSSGNLTGPNLQPLPFSVDVTQNPELYSNFFLTLLLLLLGPAFWYWRLSSFERRRWENSDYSPYD